MRCHDNKDARLRRAELPDRNDDSNFLSVKIGVLVKKLARGGVVFGTEPNSVSNR